MKKQFGLICQEAVKVEPIPVPVKGSSILPDMIKFLLTFSAGVYTGIYLSQNYEIPRVDEPAKILDKIKEYADEHKKK